MLKCSCARASSCRRTFLQSFQNNIQCFLATSPFKFRSFSASRYFSQIFIKKYKFKNSATSLIVKPLRVERKLLRRDHQAHRLSQKAMLTIQRWYLTMRCFRNGVKASLLYSTLYLFFRVYVMNSRIAFEANKTENISNFSCSFSVSFQKSKFSSILAPKVPRILNSRHFAIFHL